MVTLLMLVNNDSKNIYFFYLKNGAQTLVVRITLYKKFFDDFSGFNNYLKKILRFRKNLQFLLLNQNE